MCFAWLCTHISRASTCSNTHTPRTGMTLSGEKYKRHWRDESLIRNKLDMLIICDVAITHSRSRLSTQMNIVCVPQVLAKCCNCCAMCINVRQSHCSHNYFECSVNAKQRINSVAELFIGYRQRAHTWPHQPHEQWTFASSVDGTDGYTLQCKQFIF